MERLQNYHSRAFPIIPFYWGYKPVTHADYRADQKRYREEVGKLSDKAHLPYDAYQKITRRIKSRWVMTGKGRFSTRTITLKMHLIRVLPRGAGPLPTQRRRSRICWDPAPVASALPLRDLPRCTSMMAILPIPFMKTRTAFTSFCRSTAGGFDYSDSSAVSNSKRCYQYRRSQSGHDYYYAGKYAGETGRIRSGKLCDS